MPEVCAGGVVRDMGDRTRVSPSRRSRERVGRSWVPSVVLAGGVLLMLLVASPLRWLGLTVLGQTIPIRSVLDTQLLLGRAVQLQGQVGDRAPLMDGQVYELSDSTGGIWVISPNLDLQSGEMVKIRGRVRLQSVMIEELKLQEVYIEEHELLERRSLEQSLLLPE
ncbi:hypothetical protein ACQ4M4_04070 [Leptolyngbya sp. AN02str]|uniref:hypothetical protein n=1 Tax=Leptolyngbya sp. AN02str TaxID=3423363 RepID=UPI003D322320